MWTRLAAGIPAALLLTGVTFWGPSSAILSLCIGFAALAYLEFSDLFSNRAAKVQKFVIIVLICTTIISLRYGLEAGGAALFLSLVFLCILKVGRASSGTDLKELVHQLAFEILGFFYITCLFGFITPISNVGIRGRAYLFLFFVTLFTGDTAAYFIGSRWGKRPLAPRVSPNKSIEGSIASFAASIFFTFVWLVFVDKGERGFHYWSLLLSWAIAGSLLGQLGDLFESLLKRSCSQKDSGSFLPGHGGVLDRIDSFFFSGPLFYFYLIYFVEAV